MNAPIHPPQWLALGGGAYARFSTAGPELVLGTCGRRARGNGQLPIIGGKDLAALLDEMRSAIGKSTAAAVVNPRLAVIFEPGKRPSGDALDLISIGRERDRTFSVIGRASIEALIQFLADHITALRLL